MYPKIVLHEKRVANMIYRHPWIFSGSIKKMDSEINSGDLVSVVDPMDRFLGIGFYNGNSSIAIKIISFEDVLIDQRWMNEKIQSCISKRKLLGFPSLQTNGYRLIHAESDGMPGLIVDVFDQTIVVQISNVGMEKIRSIIIDALVFCLHPKCIFEKSDSLSLKEEGIKSFIGAHFGELEEPVSFFENGLTLFSFPESGQKTGYFCDQKDLRCFIEKYAFQKSVLNIFSYTGASSLYALRGGAIKIVNIDRSEFALSVFEKQKKINGFQTSHENICTDVFDWFSSDQKEIFEMVILDPPALIKNRHHAEEGKKAYRFLNTKALELVSDNGIFITSSCSYFFSEEDFRFMLRQVSIRMNLELNLLHTVYESADHSKSIYCDETTYLKSFIFLVKKKNHSS